MRKQLVVIGLDDQVVDQLKETISDDFIVSYPNVPRMKSHGGRVYVESPTISGRWLMPDGVVYYSYFFEQHVPAARRALALSNTPTYPDVRATLAHDDRAVSLALALLYDTLPNLPRGFVPNGETLPGGIFVVKEGNTHCGTGVGRFNFGDADGSGVPCRSPGSFEGIVEPFLEGSSERILVLPNSTYHLKYESDDWRKNVNTKRVLAAPISGFALSDRAQGIVDGLNLDMAGVDFLVQPDGTAHLLEINAYPGLDDVPSAQIDFLADVELWWSNLPGVEGRGDRVP
jgi:hypothetical protein